MPRSQVRSGDATGRENERLQRENADAIKAAATTTTLVNRPPVEQTTDVVDYTQGGTVNPGEPVRTMSFEEAVSDGTQPGIEDIPVDQFDLDSLPDGKTDVLPDEEVVLDEPQPAAKRFQKAKPATTTVKEALAATDGEEPKVEEFRILRVNTDLEDITIGKDNHFTFREGVPYKVPRYVYDHLDEKQYVRH